MIPAAANDSPVPRPRHAPDCLRACVHRYWQRRDPRCRENLVFVPKAKVAHCIARRQQRTGARPGNRMHRDRLTFSSILEYDGRREASELWCMEEVVPGINLTILTAGRQITLVIPAATPDDRDMVGRTGKAELNRGSRRRGIAWLENRDKARLCSDCNKSAVRRVCRGPDHVSRDRDGIAKNTMTENSYPCFGVPGYQCLSVRRIRKSRHRHRAIYVL